MAQGAGQRTEPPTPRRLREARRQGEVARSRIVTAAAIVAAAAATLTWQAAAWGRALSAMLRDALAAAAGHDATPESLLRALGASAADAAWLVLPLLAAIVGAALIAAFLQVGAVFAWDPILPRLRRIDLPGGIARMLSPAAGLDLLKLTAAIAAMAALVWLALRRVLPDAVGAVDHGPDATVRVLLHGVEWLAASGLPVLAALAAVDLLLQRRRHLAGLRMTREQVLREHREDEGDPLHKAARRAAHEELLATRRLADAADADLVVTDGSATAVALRYDPQRDPAPRVLARGRGKVAAAILEIARSHGVPIVEEVALATAGADLATDATLPVPLYAAAGRALELAAAQWRRQGRTVRWMATTAADRPGGPIRPEPADSSGMS